jgi:hypothetical protein
MNTLRSSGALVEWQSARRVYKHLAPLGRSKSLEGSVEQERARRVYKHLAPLGEASPSRGISFKYPLNCLLADF